MDMNKAVLHPCSVKSKDIGCKDLFDRSFAPKQRSPFHEGRFGLWSHLPLSLNALLRAIVGVVLVGLCTMQAIAFPFVSRDGKAFSVAPHLIEGKKTIVFFHAPWSKTSSRFQVDLTDLEKARPDLGIIGVDIRTLKSAVAKQYHVTEVPYFQIYSLDGNLLKSGPQAFAEVLDLMK